MKLIYIFVVSLNISVAFCEIFTSMAHMEQLVHVERHMQHELKEYIRQEEERLAAIKNFLAQVEETLKFVNETDVIKYIGNPVNTYLMLKRFNTDWRNLVDFLSNDTKKNTFIDSLDQVYDLFPTDEDQEGAMDALFRLQDTYKLPSDSLAKGEIAGVKDQLVQPLDINEIVELGRHAYEKKDWAHAGEWFQTALTELGDRESLFDVTRDSVLDHLAYAEFKVGKVKEAFKHTQELAILMPNEQRILDNLEYFRNTLRDLNSPGRMGDDGELSTGQPKKKTGVQFYQRERDGILSSYEELCRGEVRELTKREQARMKCWYKSNSPTLRIKPQKVERVWPDPEVFLLREILTDSQIENIKQTASPSLSRATIQDPITGKLRHADYRVSKSTWLSTSNYDFLQALQTRAADVTGLDLDYAEQLQIANYGIGGHYEPHFDHARENEDKFSDLGMGNRIATILFYLSDVQAGGATVFTVGKTALFPSKGDAAFWFNLKRNGDGNPRTRHAACPVLVGHKWVSNYWIHEYGQFLRRKCSLNPKH